MENASVATMNWPEGQNECFKMANLRNTGRFQPGESWDGYTPTWDLILHFQDGAKMLHKISQMICTICQEPLGENAAGTFGVEINGTLSFGWSCCHHPVGDVAVFFGSKVCCDIWLESHPEFRATLSELIENHGKAKNANADT